MLRLIGRFAAMSIIFAQASAAMALVHAQALVGRRWYDYELEGTKSKGVASQEVQVAVHVDPIPLVPVAAGLSATGGSPNKNDLGATEAALMQFAAELHAWVPMVPFVTPYVRLRYPLQSKLASKYAVSLDGGATTTESAKTYSVSGPQVTIGAKIPAIPLVKILVEVGQGIETFKSDEIKVAGVKVDTKESGKIPSKTLLFGVELGL